MVIFVIINAISAKNAVGWLIGNRNAKTFRRLYEKLKYYVKDYHTDDWEVYRKVIPNEKLTQGKKYTIGIEQNNSKIRHYLGRLHGKFHYEPFTTAIKTHKHTDAEFLKIAESIGTYTPTD